MARIEPLVRFVSRRSCPPNIHLGSDKSYELRQLRVFQRMVEKGYIPAIHVILLASHFRVNRSNLPRLPSCVLFAILAIRSR